jgi:hypothetical protein
MRVVGRHDAEEIPLEIRHRVMVFSLTRFAADKSTQSA